VVYPKKRGMERGEKIHEHQAAKNSLSYKIETGGKGGGGCLAFCLFFAHRCRALPPLLLLPLPNNFC